MIKNLSRKYMLQKHATNGRKQLKLRRSLLICFTAGQLHMLRKNIKKMETEIE
jgi:hypothetical protein